MEYENRYRDYRLRRCGCLRGARGGKGGRGNHAFRESPGQGCASALSGGKAYISGGTDAPRGAGFPDTLEVFAGYLKIAAGSFADEAKRELYAREV